MGRYRSSIALAGGGLLISVFLIVRGPKLGDHGAGPAWAVAADLDIRQRELAAAVEARAQTLAQLPRLSWAVATDEETVRDLTPDELGFRAQAGEMIAVAQIDKVSGKATTLLRVPTGLPLQTPLTATGPHLLVAGGDLLVASAVAIEPRERADALRGVVLVARRLDVDVASAKLQHAGVSARVLAPSGVVTLTVVPALAQRPDTIIPIGASPLRLAVRLTGPNTGLWISLAIFVLLIWGTAAALAARRADAIPRGLPLPGMTLPLPVDLPSEDTPVLDLITRERNITASSNGFHHDHNGVVTSIVEIVSGSMVAGIPQTDPMPASSADLQALFREFIELRRRCGDRSEAPTFDQFARSLHSRRAEMISSHAAHEVSFQIVFIDGRAVVRAKAVNN